MLNARNQMSHTYAAQDALPIYEQLPAFIKPLNELLARLQQMQGSNPPALPSSAETPMPKICRWLKKRPYQPTSRACRGAAACAKDQEYFHQGQRNDIYP